MSSAIPEEAPQAGDSIRIEDVDVYRLFLSLMERPGPSRTSLIARPETSEFLSALAEHLQVVHFEGLDLPASLEEAESYYLGLFEVGLPAPPCPLNESNYDRTTPPGKVIHENLLYYRVFGFDLKPETKELPDHISNQLEFLSCLCRLLDQAADAESLDSIRAGKRDFIERHLLSWIPLAVGELRSLDERRYAPILGLLEVQLDQELDRPLLDGRG